MLWWQAFLELIVACVPRRITTCSDVQPAYSMLILLTILTSMRKRAIKMHQLNQDPRMSRPHPDTKHFSALQLFKYGSSSMLTYGIACALVKCTDWK